jgi:dTDP-4-amino-4,6-dideoxygalactose transaminase
MMLMKSQFKRLNLKIIIYKLQIRVDDLNQVFVTKPFLPPLEEFIPYLEIIWENRLLTNNGPFHQELEQKISDFLNVPYVSLFANGTLALFTAIQALDLKGEVITTPFSFVATTHALWWNKIKPVFVDIEPNTFTLDAEKIEKAITTLTTGILPVHVYGYPCNVDRIKEIGSKYGLKVLYDAAHTFGAKYREESLCRYGDMSILSFHATKVFNTFEGGAIICHSREMKEHIDNLKNFGFRGETTVIEPGINAKMNEFQAALGLLQLKYFNKVIEERKKIFDYYLKELQDINGITLPPKIKEHTSNYAYFPIFIDGEGFGITRDELFRALKSEGIFPRRYFFPLISHFPPYNDFSDKTFHPTASLISEKVLCLPIYPGLEIKTLKKIVKIIKRICDGK